MREQRFAQGDVEVREGANGTPTLVGYAAVFNSESRKLGSGAGFIEQVDPGAFERTLAEADVRALANHDANWLLGRVKSGTLRLSTDQRGLRYEIDINPNDPDGQRALEKVKRGDWSGSSFTFVAQRDQWNWDQKPAQRRLLEVGLIDVGPVTYEAYPGTDVAARALDPLAKSLGRPVDELVTAMERGEMRSLLDGEQTEEASEEKKNEGRVGRRISAATRDALTKAMKEIENLLGYEPPEGEGEPVDSDADDQQRAQKVLDTLAEFRAEPQVGQALEVYEMQLKARERRISGMRRAA